MKKILALGFILIGLLVVYTTLIHTGEEPKATVQVSSSRKLFLGTRSKLSTVSSNDKSKSLDGCEDVTENLENLDFNLPTKDWIESIQIETFSKCQDPSFKTRLAAIQSHCFDKFNEAECSTNSVFLRAQLRTRQVEDAEDRELLADLIIKEFAGNKPDFEKLAKYSDKLMNLDPNQKSYQKLWASSKVISKLFSADSPMEVAEEVNNRVDPDLLNDPSMSTVKLAMATGLEPINVESYARGYLSQKPDSGMHEILGWALWKQNRQAEAIQELTRASALNPNDQWLKDQLVKVSAKGANAEAYQARIMLGLNIQDLYE